MLKQQKHMVTLRSAMLLAAFMTLAAAASAQNFLAVFSSPVYDSIKVGGKCIAIERFDPVFGGVKPAVILIHGSDGLEEHGDAYRKAGKLLAANGYVAILVHYFDATGIPQWKGKGLQMTEEEFKTWMSVIKATVKYAKCQPNVCSERIGLVGFSLGAYLAVATGATEHEDISAVVEMFGGVPTALVHNFSEMPPTLILHGECDDIVPVSEAKKLARDLKASHRCYEMTTFPCQGHIFDDATQKEASALVKSFLDRNL